jgi:hypothetical protein
MLGKINWKPSKTDVRKSGLGIIIGAAVVFLVFILSHRMGFILAVKIFGSFAGLGFLMILLPGPLRFAYFAWMGIGFVIGHIVSPLILFVFFFGFITPFGIILRIFRKSPLNLKVKDTATWWTDFDKEITKESFERQS